MDRHAHIEKPASDEPVFNTFRRRPLRPFYSLREFQFGLLTLLVLAAVTGWVAWRGARPDPDLFALPDHLLANKGGTITVYERPLEPWIEPGALHKPVSLTPFPDNLAGDGWRIAGAPQMFDESNLYSKIDGRETFYKSYGFQKLHCLALASDGLDIDIELFDLGAAANALGALSAEISSPDAVVALTPVSLGYATRNGGFLAQGRYYARLIGSDDDESIRRKITGLLDAFRAALPAEPLPWAYRLLAGDLRVNPARIQFEKENAFSLEFANEFYSAQLPGHETEVFVSRRADADEAAALAGRIADSFAAQGKRTETGLIQNEYSRAFDGARSHGAFVIGVRLAPSAAEAAHALETLKSALERFSNE